MRGMGRLSAVVDNIWIAKTPLALPGGIEVGATMTVIRHDDGGVLLHSPIALDDALADEIDALGPVRSIVAPNLLHHLFVAGARARYPAARLYASAALRAKRADIAFDHELDSETQFPGLLTLPIRGAPKLEETLFYHRDTQTLITTDLYFNIDEPRNWLTAAVLWLIGDYPGLRQGLVLRVFARDRAAWRASMAEVFALPFENLIMAHGVPVIGDARNRAWKTSAWGLPKALRGRTALH